jgi:hypothetical protein
VYRNGRWEWLRPDATGALLCMRGTAWNDIFVAGHFGSMDHFNGIRWTHIKPFGFDIGEYVYIACLQDNVYLCCTTRQRQWLIMHGRRID